MNKNEFLGKVVIVTGAAQGIGFEICKQLAENGAIVVLNDIDEGLALSAAQEISEKHGQCISMAGDSSDLDFVKRIVSTTVKQFGRLDIAVANAGITLFGDFFTYPASSLYEVLNTNVAGTFFLAQQAAIQMKKQREGGSLLFTSSVTGHQAHKDLTAYGTSKAAIEMLAKTLVVELSPFKINVNTIAPGATLTERTLNDPTYQEVWSRITPLGRAASTFDIASASLFLISDKARHITGQSLVIDGGWSATSPTPY